MFLLEIDKIEDSRGFFARVNCRDTFLRWGLERDFPQSSLSYNKRRGTLRGLHYQLPPQSETKIVRCTRGAIYDVVVDLRPDSNTFKRWFGVDLAEANYRSLYIPEGLAHGFLTLTDSSEVHYQISKPYVAGFDGGVRWDDPAFSVEWPMAPEVMSDRDRTYPDYTA